ncbi:MAG: LysR family transcriptional regulator [Rhodobacteraceae bacterium]|nr:LysR family transcriptional regulator [Paracoccaceae bacterium]
MKFKQLVCFATAARENSLTRASSILKISQPAVGMQIRSLETSCGVKLIKRHSRGITLTPAGRILAQRAGEILDLLDTTEKEIAQFRDSESNIVRLGITPSIGQVLISGLLEMSNTLYPGLKLLFEQGFVDDIQKVWERAEIDLIFTNRIDKSHAAEMIPLFWEHFYLLGKPEFIRTLPDPLPVSLLADLPLVFDGREVTLLTMLTKELRRQGMQINDKIEVPSHSIRKEYVIKGLRCCIAPYAFLINQVECGECAAVAIDHPSARRLMHLVGPVSGNNRSTMVGIKDLILIMVRDHVANGNYGWSSPDASF